MHFISRGNLCALAFLALSDCAAGTQADAPLMPSTAAHSFQNEPTGFRNIEWGTPLREIPDKMTLIGKEKSQAGYKRAGDKLSFGGAQLETIVYFFYNDKFASVLIDTKHGSMPAMVKTFETQFGKGKQANPSIPSYFWDGGTTLIYLDCNEVNLSCKALIRSTRLYAEKAADEAAAARGAKKDF